jgi:hypothetical protein
MESVAQRIALLPLVRAEEGELCGSRKRQAMF